MINKVKTVEQALDLIKDGDAIAISAAGMVGYPEYIVKNLEDRYVETGHPGALTLFAGCGHGIPKESVGDARFAHPGFLKKIICAHPDTVVPLRTMIEQNQLEAYVLPQGVLNQLYRASAAKQPGLLTKIGMGTYIDPRQDGGKMNDITKEDIVRLMEIDGEEWLYYKSHPVTVGIIRGTTADVRGNISIEREALRLEILEIALAAKASGGKVIVQVERVVEDGTIPAKNVVIPSEIVDAVVVCKQPEIYHRQTGGTVYSPYLSGELKKPAGNLLEIPKTLKPADIICRRAAFELFEGAIVNVGVGVGAGVGNVAAMENMTEKVTFTIELGAIGGVPQPGADFASTLNAEAFIAHPSMFDFYHGGGLDITFLGSAEIDSKGNVNVSRFANRAAGQGGFIDISQTSKKVVFCTYFTAKGFEAVIEDARLQILHDGEVCKFVPEVEQITFNGTIAGAKGQAVLYVTERCVFELTADGLLLTEIAPGVDVEKDILRHMKVKPAISDSLKEMDSRIFVPGRMGCFD